MKCIKTGFPFLLLMALLEPVAYADIAAPTPSIIAGMGAVILVLALVVNYTLNFALSFPLSRIVANTRAGKVAVGLLAITPIMLVLEVLFIGVLEPRLFHELAATWLFSFVLIFACYFIAGRRAWEMKSWQAAITASVMAVITNPAYLVPFF